MSWVQSLHLPELGRFFRTRTLGRSVVMLLGAAILLLLAINFSTYVLIRRTADFNTSVDANWQSRRAGRVLLINLKDAETAQRGYLLTGQSGFLLSYRSALAAHESLLANLRTRVAVDDPGEASAEAITRLSRDKILEMNQAIDVFRARGPNGAIELVQSGRGRQLMEQLDTELNDLDQRIGAKLQEGRARSEASANVTVLINLLGGLLIVVLAGMVFMLIRRYVGEIQQARDDLDRVNSGLEDTVRARTAALTRANEEVQRFAYIVSHDLRSPLVNVMGYTAELEQAGKTIDAAITQAQRVRDIDPAVVSAVREDIPEAVGFIRASTEKMDRLINAILKLSRDGRRALLPETLDMVDVAERAGNSVRHQIEEAAGEFVVQALPALESDRLSIEQIIGNLVDNAVKYAVPDRPLRVTVSGRDLADGWVEYDISDNGRGIADKDHERIFELFRRSGRQDRPGEGLGLAFVRNSVRRLGGDISLESRLGEGSTFRLKFPKRLVPDDAGETA